MPDDSVSEITDLEEEDILAKYYRGKEKHDSGIFAKKSKLKEDSADD